MSSTPPVLRSIDQLHPAAKKLGALGGYRINALTGRNDDMCRPCPDVPSLDLVIVGGESGPGARPMHPDWARSLRDQCNAAGVAFHFKQWGEWHADAMLSTDTKGQCPPPNMRIGKKRAGRLLDGRTWDEMPGVSHD